MSRFGEPWFTGLPGGWSVRPFKRLGSISNGQVDPRHQDYRDLPLFAPNHIESATGRLLAVETADKQGADSGKYPVRAGEIVYSKIRPALRKIIVAPCDGLCSADMYAISPKTGVSSRYLFWAMLSEGFSAAAELASDRVAMPKVNRETLADFPLPLPRFSTQQAIADYLDEKTAAIDALIEKKRKLLDLLAEERAALINQAVTKGLDPTVPMKDSGIPWIGDVPAHWDVKPLKRVAPYITVGIVITPAKYYVDDGVPCPRLLNVREMRLVEDDLVFISEESNTLLRKSKIFAGDLLCVRSGQPGTTAVVDQRFDGANCIDLIIIRKSSRMDSQFLAYAMNSEAVRTQYTLGSTGAIQTHFNVGMAREISIPQPPRAEQQCIAEYLDSQLKRASRINEINLRQVDRIQEYRQALITAAVTGQLDIGAAA